MNIRNITSFGTNSIGNTPIQSLFQFNNQFNMNFEQPPQHVQTRNSTKNSFFNTDQAMDMFNVTNIPSSISQYANKDSLFCVDPKGRTRRSKAAGSALSSIMSSNQKGQRDSSRNHQQNGSKGSSFNIQSITQHQLQSQVKSSNQILASKVFSQDFLNKIINAPGPTYNLNLLDTNPPTSMTTKCKNTPFNSDKPAQANYQSSFSSEQNQVYKAKEEAKNQKPHGKTLDEEDPELIQRRALLNLEHNRIKDKRKRQKKSSVERNILESEFVKNPVWDYQKKCELALMLGFTFSQISKWNWDRRKKDQPNLKN